MLVLRDLRLPPRRREGCGSDDGGGWSAVVVGGAGDGELCFSSISRDRKSVV